MSYTLSWSPLADALCPFFTPVVSSSAVLLSILGVPWSAVRDEYLLSNVYREKEVVRRLGQLRELAAKSQRLPPADVDNMTNAEALLVQDVAQIDASRDEILDEFSSFDECAEAGLGVDPAVLGALRDSLLK